MDEPKVPATTQHGPGEGVAVVTIRPDQIDVIREAIAPGLNDSELEIFFFECQRSGVHPMDRMIYPTVYEDDNGKRKLTLITSIDLMRSRAEASGEYRGQKDVEHGPMRDWPGVPKQVPLWARAVMLRRDPATGDTYEIPARAEWNEYYPDKATQQWMWKKRPMGQLAKCAEALALRKAFPKQLRGMYSNDEMDQAVDVTPTTKRPKGEVRPDPKKAAAAAAAATTTQAVAPNGTTAGPAPDPAPDPKETLKKAMLALLGGDEAGIPALLKDITMWKNKEKVGDKTVEKEHFVTKIALLSDAWARKAMGALEAREDYKAMKSGGTLGAKAPEPQAEPPQEVIEAEVVNDPDPGEKPNDWAENPYPDDCIKNAEKCGQVGFRAGKPFCETAERECRYD